LDGFYFGKLNSTSVSEDDVSGFTFVTTTEAVNSYVEYPIGLGYCYILIPDTFIQPSQFRDSFDGCGGFVIPTNLIGQVTTTNIYMNVVTYNVYRTFYSFHGEINIWMCD